MKKQYTEQDILELQKLITMLNVVSMNAKVKTNDLDETNLELGDFVVDDGLGPQELLEQKCKIEKLNTYIDKLRPRDRQVIVERFGLIDGNYKTLDEVGQKYNITRERVRQIEAKALKKLRWLIMTKGKCRNINDF